jgi:hypothetical protein
MLKVIDLAMRRPWAAVSAAAMRAADSRACAQVARIERRGVPRTDSEWTALVKLASGEHDIQPAYCDRLISLGLVERRAGLPELTRHGRLTLGLPD